MKHMRHLREALVILLAVALATYAALGLAHAASDLAGGVGGWGGVAAIGFTGAATLLALVSSALAGLVVRHRSWRTGYLVVTLVGAVALVVVATRAEPPADGFAALALGLAGGLALWLPVGARWWLGRSSAPPVGPRAGIVTASVVGFVLAVAAGVVVAVVGPELPGSLLGPTVLLLVVAAFASGRVPDTFALALLAAVAAWAVLFELGSLAEGRLVIGALALASLVTFAWRPAARRLVRARGAARLAEIPRAARREQTPDDAARTGDATGTGDETLADDATETGEEAAADDAPGTAEVSPRASD